MDELTIVPTLVIDGTILTEVAATLFYLARTFPQAGLMPTGPLGEAEAVSWMSFLASTVHPAVGVGPERVAEVWQIAEKKLVDLNCASIESAMSMIEGSARAMGLQVVE